MHEDALHPPVENPVRHEPTDINTRPLRITAMILLISFIAIPVVLLWLFRYYERTATRPDRDLVDPQVRNAGPSAPEPRIQGVPRFHGPVPRADMEQLRRESQQR